VTILPAGQALGVTEQLPLVERHLYGEDYLYDMLAVFLGGRASELVVFGRGSTGASNDLAKATDLSIKMVREFGLSSALGPVSYPLGGSTFLGEGGGRSRADPLPNRRRRRSMPRWQGCCARREQKAVGVLKEHRDVLDQLVQLLLTERDRGRVGGVRTRSSSRSRPMARV
jgi:cell division protease FtsH